MRTKTFILAIAMTAALAAGCEKYDDTDILRRIEEHEKAIQDHERRIAALEELCGRLNTDLARLGELMKAVAGKVYITSWAPVTLDGRTVGYNLLLSDGSTMTLMSGTDGRDGADGAAPAIGENGNWWIGGKDTGVPATGEGGADGLTPRIGSNGNWWIGDSDTGVRAAAKDGADGKDAAAPVIGAREAEDGTIYWTLDGEWLLDAEGNRIPCTGPKGEDGSDASGPKGDDGVTPLLRVSDQGMWEVSYDGGTTWETLGQATGEKGEKGDTGATGAGDGSLFRSVTVTTVGGKSYLVFTLADGTTYKVEIAE